MMRLPPGEPVTSTGLPSFSTMVGDIDDNGRLPGPGRLASKPTSPNAFDAPGAAVKSSSSLLSRHAGAVGDEADAIGKVQRVGIADRIAVAGIDHRIMRGVAALARRLHGQRFGPRRRMVGSMLARCLAAYSFDISMRDRRGDESGIAEITRAIGISALHRFDQEMQRGRRALLHVGSGNPSRMFRVSSNTMPPDEGSGIDTMS